MAPNTASFVDAGLPVGSTFTTADSMWRITVNSQSGSGANSLINVTVSDIRPPAITTHPQSITVRRENSARLTVAANGQSLQYQWRKNGIALSNGGNISGATTTELYLTGTTADDTTGTYTVVVSNAYGTVTSDGAVITVVDGGGDSGGGCGYTTPPEQILLIGWAVLLLCRFLQPLRVNPLQPREEAA